MADQEQGKEILEKAKEKIRQYAQEIAVLASEEKHPIHDLTNEQVVNDLLWLAYSMPFNYPIARMEAACKIGSGSIKRWLELGEGERPSCQYLSKCFKSLRFEKDKHINETLLRSAYTNPANAMEYVKATDPNTWGKQVVETNSTKRHVHEISTEKLRGLIVQMVQRLAPKQPTIEMIESEDGFEPALPAPGTDT